MRVLIKKLREKYKEAVEEIKDLSEEHNAEREDFLDTIRDLERRASLYKAVLNTALPEKEVNRVLAKCQYDDDNNRWVVVPFTIKAR